MTSDPKMKELAITADDEIVELYIDGVKKDVRKGHWRDAKNVQIPADSRVIAVKAEDVSSIYAGLLASFVGEKNFTVTDKSWKCTTVEEDGWMLTSFDDKSWPYAQVSKKNDEGSKVAGIQTDAKWIWTENSSDPNIDKTVFFRGYLGTKKLSITADDEIVELYIDGVNTKVKKGNCNYFQEIEIPAGARVIAVKAKDVGKKVAGILACIHGGKHVTVTDQSWKCTTIEQKDWMSTSFDDSSWPDAVVSARNSIVGSKLQLNDLGAKWIWTKNSISPNIDETVYCRGYLD